ncbi:hypothetical protein CEXT_711931 [Caerostris extrusa]|uniref:Uncharacterized protein n=1 Tax=Caerostris extrusa TaxID=172846 RepID=A0AAV4PKG5_CAEEX|nr:hypothetical protein CEXT_711931 [Caerostris extrusa]
MSLTELKLEMQSDRQLSLELAQLTERRHSQEITVRKRHLYIMVMRVGHHNTVVLNLLNYPPKTHKEDPSLYLPGALALMSDSCWSSEDQMLANGNFPTEKLLNGVTNQ